jgi:hypothetical protein
VPSFVTAYAAALLGAHWEIDEYYTDLYAEYEYDTIVYVKPFGIYNAYISPDVYEGEPYLEFWIEDAQSVVIPDPDPESALYEHVFSKDDFVKNGGSNKTVTLNGWTWIYSNIKTDPLNDDNGRGVQIGTKNNPVGSWSLSTAFAADIVITGYEIVFCVGSGGSGSYTIQFGTHTKSGSLSTDSTAVSAYGLAMSAPSFSLSFANVTRALFIKSVKIYYQGDGASAGGDDPDNPSGEAADYETAANLQGINQLQKSLPDGRAGLPSTGTYSVLVVPVQFSNKMFTSAELSNIDIVFNGSSVNTGWESVRSFYQKSSYGKLNITYDIAAAVTAPNPSTSYTDGDTADITIIKSVMPTLNGLHNFADYDHDNDGDIDSVIFIYSVDYSESDDTPWWAWV